MNRSPWDFWALASFPLLYFLNIGHYFWVRPDPSDPLEYLGPVVWRDSAGLFPYFDRLNLGSGLAIFYQLLPGPAFWTGPLYALCISTLTLILAQVWLYRRVGFAAALVFGVFFNSGWYFFFFGSQIFPEPTLVFYALLSLMAWSASESHSPSSSVSVRWLGVAGFATALACFSKVTAVFLPISLVWRLWRQAPRLRFFLAGLVGGALASLAIYAILYDLNSLVSSARQFFGSNLQSNYVGRGSYNNAVSYFDVVLNRNFVPVFLGLLVCNGAYRSKVSRLAMDYAWIFLGTILFVYWISNRGYTPIPNYVYPAYFFCALGLAAYFGTGLEALTSTRRLALATLCLALLVVGLRFGITHDPTDIFAPGYNPNLHKWVRLFYSGGLVAITVLLLAHELAPRPARVGMIVLLTALWGSAFAGGLMRKHFASTLIPLADFYYTHAPSLELPTAQNVDVYVENWNKRGEPERILWIYRLFFDRRYDRTRGHLAHDRAVSAGVRFLRNKEELESGRGEQILTDQKEIVESLFHQARLLQSKSIGQITYFVYQK